MSNNNNSVSNNNNNSIPNQNDWSGKRTSDNLKLHKDWLDWKHSNQFEFIASGFLTNTGDPFFCLSPKSASNFMIRIISPLNVTNGEIGISVVDSGTGTCISSSIVGYFTNNPIHYFKDVLELRVEILRLHDALIIRNNNLTFP